MLFCRKPSSANASFKASGSVEALKLKASAYTELKASYEANLNIMKSSIAEIKLFVEKAFGLFGSAKCEDAGVRIAKKIDAK